MVGWCQWRDTSVLAVPVGLYVKEMSLSDRPGATLAVTLVPPELRLEPLPSHIHTSSTPGFL